jgi:hypothetical protein
MLNNNICIVCLSCNIKESITTVKLSENSRDKCFSSVTSAFILLPFLSVALHESGTKNALLGPLLNNTEVFLTPFISTQNHTLGG